MLAHTILAAAGDGANTTAAVTSDLVMFSALVGWLTPIIVAYINRPGWASWVRLAMTLAFCIIVAAVTTWLEGGLSGGRWVTSALVVATLAVVTYQQAWKTTIQKIEAKKAQKIEAKKTSR